MAKAEPKIGVAAVSELVSVGPISLMLEMASVVEIAGRMMPTMANISAALVSQYQLSRKNGANSQYTMAEVAMETRVPERASDPWRPMLVKWLESAKRKAEARL